jgi:hypothetical protein
MQPGQNQLDTRHARLGVNIGRDPPPVVDDLHRAVGMQGDLDVRRVTRYPLVRGVVQDLVDKVTYTTAVGRPDVHAGPLADGVQPLQVGKVVGPVHGFGLELCGHLA